MEELEIGLLLDTIDRQLSQQLPGLSVRELFTRLLEGRLTLDWQQWWDAVAEGLWQSATAELQILGQLVVLAVLAAILHRLETGLARSNIQRVTALMVQAVAVLLVVQSGSRILAFGLEAVERMAQLMALLVPVQLLLMAGLGNVQTAGLLQPPLMLFLQGVAVLVPTVLFPVISGEFVLKLVNSLSEGQELSRLAAWLRKLVLTGVSFSAMILLGLISLLGVGGQVMDQLSVRTIKYIAGTSIPVVGGMLSSLLDTLLQGALAMRNALGMVGLVLVLLLTVLPGLRLLVLYMLYSFAAAILQPLGDSAMVQLLEQLAGSILLVFAVVILTGVCFFFMVLIVLSASGLLGA